MAESPAPLHRDLESQVIARARLEDQSTPQALLEAGLLCEPAARGETCEAGAPPCRGCTDVGA